MELVGELGVAPWCSRRRRQPRPAPNRPAMKQDVMRRRDANTGDFVAVAVEVKLTGELGPARGSDERAWHRLWEARKLVTLPRAMVFFAALTPASASCQRREPNARR